MNLLFVISALVKWGFSGLCHNTVNYHYHVAKQTLVITVTAACTLVIMPSIGRSTVPYDIRLKRLESAGERRIKETNYSHRSNRTIDCNFILPLLFFYFPPVKLVSCQRISAPRKFTRKENQSQREERKTWISSAYCWGFFLRSG